MNNTPFKLAIPLLATTLLVAGCTLWHHANKPIHPLQQKIEADMVLVEGGRFEMGSEEPGAKPADGPVHTVAVNSFYMAKFEVTQALFEAVMGPSISYFQSPSVPVNNLSWQQANLERLLRSFNKESQLHTSFHFVPENWQALMNGYQGKAS